MLRDTHTGILLYIFVLTQKVGQANSAWTKTITSSSVNGGPYATQNAIDGNPRRDAASCECCAATAHEPNPWYQLEFGENHTVYRIRVEGRTDDANYGRTKSSYATEMDANSLLFWLDVTFIP